MTDLNVPGFNFHGLQGMPKRYSIHVNGPGVWLRMQQAYDLWYAENRIAIELSKIKTVELDRLEA